MALAQTRCREYFPISFFIITLELLQRLLLVGVPPMNICFQCEKSTTKLIKYSKTTSGMRRITVGIPAYNEERNIVNLLRSLEGQWPLISEVIVSDSSSDGTTVLVRDFARRSRLGITLLHHRIRKG